MTPLNVPRGVGMLFSVGNSRRVTINENQDRRPDRVLGDYTSSPMKEELVNNYITNVSPISCKKGISYTIVDSTFTAYFRRF